MSGWFSRMAAGVVMFAVTAVAARAEEQTGINQASAEAAKDAKVSPDAKAVEKLALAHNLIQYGRTNKAPEALITAARILNETDTTNATAKPETEKDPKAPKVEAKAKPEIDNSPKALLEEAKKLSGNDACIVSLANSVKITARGAIPGPKVGAFDIPANSIDTFRIVFRGGELAEVAIHGDGDTRLDLYIYDQNLNLVTSQVGPGDRALASWVPKWTGTFIIKVVNRGTVYNHYGLATN